MPLNCDCYPGCWGRHSEDWIRITGDPDTSFREAVRRLPRGTFVKMEDHLRVESPKELARLEKPTIRLVNPLGFWAVRFVTHGGADYVQVNWIKRSWRDAVNSLIGAYYWGEVLHVGASRGVLQ